jgi:hypothetical protein
MNEKEKKSGFVQIVVKMLAIQKKLIEIDKGCRKHIFSIDPEIKGALLETDCGYTNKLGKRYLCSTCEATRKTLLQTTKECAENELRLVNKLDDIWSESGVEDHNGILLNRIHTILCNRFRELNKTIEFCEKELSK